MNKYDLNAAESEAQRFLAKVKAFRKEAEGKKASKPDTVWLGGIGSIPERAALDRSSMDLSRALASLRKHRQ